MLSPALEISSNFFIKVSQAEFMSGTICFILCALKVGLRVLRIRFHSSPSTIVIILLKGSGNLNSTYPGITYSMLRNLHWNYLGWDQSFRLMRLMPKGRVSRYNVHVHVANNSGFSLTCKCMSLAQKLARNIQWTHNRKVNGMQNLAKFSTFFVWGDFEGSPGGGGGGTPLYGL